jgi:hypothetical protein
MHRNSCSDAANRPTCCRRLLFGVDVLFPSFLTGLLRILWRRKEDRRASNTRTRDQIGNSRSRSQFSSCPQLSYNVNLIPISKRSCLKLNCFEGIHLNFVPALGDLNRSAQRCSPCFDQSERWKHKLPTLQQRSTTAQVPKANKACARWFN